MGFQTSVRERAILVGEKGPAQDMSDGQIFKATQQGAALVRYFYAHYHKSAGMKIEAKQHIVMTL